MFTAYRERICKALKYESVAKAHNLERFELVPSALCRQEHII